MEITYNIIEVVQKMPGVIIAKWQVQGYDQNEQLITYEEMSSFPHNADNVIDQAALLEEIKLCSRAKLNFAK